MVVCPSASACVMATAVIVSKRPSRLRNVWRWALRGCAGLWRIVRPIVAAPRLVSGAGDWLRDAGPAHLCVRQALEAWGQQQSPLPLLVEKPGRTKDWKRPDAGMGKASCGRWRSNTGKGGRHRRKCALSWCIRVNWRSRKPNPMEQPKRRKPKPWPTTCGRCTPGGSPVCLMPKPPSPNMQAGGRERRGRRPRPWRYHTVRYRIVAATAATRRARRGRPAKTDLPPTESGYRVVVEVEA